MIGPEIAGPYWLPGPTAIGCSVAVKLAWARAGGAPSGPAPDAAAVPVKATASNMLTGRDAVRRALRNLAYCPPGRRAAVRSLRIRHILARIIPPDYEIR